MKGKTLHAVRGSDHNTILAMLDMQMDASTITRVYTYAY